MRGKSGWRETGRAGCWVRSAGTAARVFDLSRYWPDQVPASWLCTVAHKHWASGPGRSSPPCPARRTGLWKGPRPDHCPQSWRHWSHSSQTPSWDERRLTAWQDDSSEDVVTCKEKYLCPVLCPVLLSHHVKHRQLSLLVQLDLVTPHPGPGLARLTDDDKSRYLQKTSQACEDDYEISGYMIAVLFVETRSPREVEQEDRQRVMFLSAWIDSTPCKLWIISFQYNLRVILLCHILSSLCHLTVTGWYLFSPSPSSAWSAFRLTLLPDLICDICRTVSK